MNPNAGNRRLALLLSCFGALALSATSCKGSTSDVKSEKSMEVMGTWAAFFNATIDGVPSLLKSHFEKMPIGEELTVEHLSKNATFGCTGIGWMQMKKDKAKSALDAAKKASTGKFTDLPPLGDAMWAAATKIDTSRAEFCKNLKAEDFKDDKGVKANELHKTLSAAADDWQKASNAMAEALDKFENEQVLAQIEKYAKDKDYSYWFRQFNFNAKQLLSKLQRDPANGAASIGEVEASHAELTAFAKGKEKLNGVFKAYVDGTDRFMATAKKMRRALAEAKDDEAKKKIIGDKMSNLVSGYNSLVSLRNSMADLEANNLLK